MRALLVAAVLAMVGCGNSTIVSPCPGEHCDCSGAVCTCKEGATCLWDAGHGGSVACNQVNTCSGTCTDSCSGACAAQSICNWATGTGSTMTCDHAWCILSVGGGGSVTCTSAKCNVTCPSGSCSLACTSSTCTLRCPGDVSDGGLDVSDAGGGQCS